jgi:hypothetical protein
MHHASHHADHARDVAWFFVANIQHAFLLQNAAMPRHPLPHACGKMFEKNGMKTLKGKNVSDIRVKRSHESCFPDVCPALREEGRENSCPC